MLHPMMQTRPSHSLQLHVLMQTHPGHIWYMLHRPWIISDDANPSDGMAYAESNDANPVQIIAGCIQ
jgi:hypothetical protein